MATSREPRAIREIRDGFHSAVRVRRFHVLAGWGIYIHTCPGVVRL